MNHTHNQDHRLKRGNPATPTIKNQKINLDFLAFLFKLIDWGNYLHEGAIVFIN